MSANHKPTISIRKAEMNKDCWLDRNGNWGLFKDRKKFHDRNGKAQENAELFVLSHYGPEFHSYGLFPNS